MLLRCDCRLSRLQLVQRVVGRGRVGVWTVVTMGLQWVADGRIRGSSVKAEDQNMKRRDFLKGGKRQDPFMGHSYS